MSNCLHLVVKADWLVETANARWEAQNQGFRSNVWFEHAEPFTSLPGFSLSLCGEYLRPELSRRLLAFMDRNKDILDLNLVTMEVRRVLERSAARQGNMCSCEACRASTTDNVTRIVQNQTLEVVMDGKRADDNLVFVPRRTMVETDSGIA